MLVVIGVIVMLLGLALCLLSAIFLAGPPAEVGVGLIVLGMFVAFVAALNITSVAVPDARAGVRVAKEMAYIRPVSFAQAERVLPSVLARVQIPGGWNFHAHGSYEGVNYWRFSLGGDGVAKVCVSYGVMSTTWSARSGACPREATPSI